VSIPGTLTVFSAALDGAVLHPKLVVADLKMALLGSANITGRGLSMNLAICAQPLETDKIAHCTLFITLIFRPFQEMADMLGSATSMHVGAL
jgi:phosphatidylserine/phosphatidylglycerophosphate/cardiolipin synthase-like enzyme